MNENETSLYPVVEPSAFPITNRNQPESTMLRMQEDPPATTEPKMSTDVDFLELDGEFDYEGYQVVRREFFAHTYEPSVTFNNYKFYVNAACLNRFPTVDFVQVLVNQERKILAIRPCEEGDRDAYDGPRYVVVFLASRAGLEIRPGTLVKIRMRVRPEEELLPFHRCSSRPDIWPKIRS